MLHPIQVGNELICACGCGAVVGNIEENNNEVNTIPKTILSIDLYMLGSALNKNVKSCYGRTREQLYEENILRNINNLIKKFDLPEKFIMETFQQMKRNKRGFRSENEYIKQLIKILSKDENYLHIHKLRKIKAWYEKFSNM